MPPSPPDTWDPDETPLAPERIHNPSRPPEPSWADIVDQLRARSGQPTRPGETPVPDALLSRLGAEVNCRRQVEALRREIDHRFADADRKRDNVRRELLDRLATLPADSAAAILQHLQQERDGERSVAISIEESRHKFRRYLLDRVLDSVDKVTGGLGGACKDLVSHTWFVILLGVALVLASAGAFLSTAGVRIGDWLEIDAAKEANEDRAEAEDGRALPAPVGPSPGADP